MGQKAKGHQELDRAIGEWKQQLLEEAEEIITGDFADMKVELAETTKRLEALGREAKKATAEAKVAGEEIREDQIAYHQGFILHTGLACLIGSFIGSFIMFLLLWYFW